MTLILSYQYLYVFYFFTIHPYLDNCRVQISHLDKKNYLSPTLHIVVVRHGRIEPRSDWLGWQVSDRRLGRLKNGRRSDEIGSVEYYRYRIDNVKILEKRFEV